MPKPIVTIDKFGGMDNIFLAQSIAPKIVSGQSVLSPRYKTTLIAETTNLGMPTQFSISPSGFFVYFVTDLGKVCRIESNNGVVHHIHTINQTNPVNTRSGIFVNNSGSIIYAHKNNIGLGLLQPAIVATSSNTMDLTINISSSPYNFAVGDKVVSLTTYNQFQITAISGVTVTLSDEILLIDSYLFLKDNRWALSGPVGYNPDMSIYDRQIIQNRQEVFIANGNNVASFQLSGPLGFSNYTADASGLPSLMRVTSLACNSDRVLIGGDQQGIGYVVYWDGTTIGEFQNIFETTSPPKLIQPYKNGFIYLTGSTLRYTDGLQDQLMARVPDIYTTTEDINAYPNASTLLNDKVLIGMSPTNSSGRAKQCVWAFDPENGFIQIPLYSSTDGFATEQVTIGAMLRVRTPSPFIYVGVKVGTKSYILKLTDEPAENWRASFFLKFPQKVPVSSIGLNLGKNSEIIGQSQTSSVTVAVSEVLYPYFNKFTLTNDVHTIKQIYANNFSEPPEVGDLIVCTSGDSAGQFAFIEQLENLTTKYLITLDKDLAIAPSPNSKWNLHKAKKTETRQISTGNIVFDNSFNLKESLSTDQIIVDVFGENAKQIQINSISINQ